MQPLSIYVPSPALMTCPYPMRALDLWFTLRWLGVAYQKSLRFAQRMAHQSPPPSPTEEVMAQPVIGGMSMHVVLGNQPPWLVYKNVQKIPEVIGRLSARVMQRLQAAAILSFVETCEAEMRKRNLLPPILNQWIFGPPDYPSFDVFAVWAGLVDKQPGLTAENFQTYRAAAEVCLVQMVMDGGIEAARSAAVRICEAIEINFKE